MKCRVEKKKWSSLEASFRDARLDVGEGYSLEYVKPQVVLTRVDKLEERVKNDIRNGLLVGDPEKLVKELQDQKIESVVSKLSIPRDSVHFIENYNEKRRV